MTIPTVPGLPPSPARTDPPAAFRAKADALLAALGPWTAALNATVAGLNAGVTSVTNALATMAGYVATSLSARDATVAAANLAINAPGTKATSVTPVTIGAGEKVFMIQPGKALGSGPTASAAVRGDGAKRMLGPILSYNEGSGELRMRSDSFQGAGEYSDWEIMLASADALPPATKEDVWAGVAGKVVTPAVLDQADDFQDIAYVAPIAWNVATQGKHVRVTLPAGNPTFAVPSGMKRGKFYVMLVGSGAGGARSGVFPGVFDFGGVTPVFSTAAGKWDALRLQCTDEATGACKATWIKAA